MKFSEIVSKAKAEGSFDDLIDTGDFTLEIARANGKSKDNGGQIGVQWVVVNGPEDQPLPQVENDDGVYVDDPAIGQKSWVNLYFTENAAAISIRQLKSWGVPEEFIDQAEKPEDIAKILPGIKVDASVTRRTWGKDDENTNNVITVNELLVGPVVPGDGVDPTEEEPEPEAKPKRASRAKAKVDPNEEPF